MHFIRAAELVAAILHGTWTHEFPPWADAKLNISAEDGDTDYTRAVWTAEAFILLFTAYNPRFDSTRFLRACGFTE